MAEPTRPTPLRALATVTALEHEGGTNHRLRLDVPGWPGSEPGQFAMLSPGEVGGTLRRDPLLPRPMAVYREAGSEVEILFKVHGRGTALLAELRPKAQVRIVGPLGRGFADPAPGQRAVLVAGGTGIASVYTLAQRLRDRGIGVRVCLGARSADDLMGDADFEALGVPVAIATEDGSRGHRGRVTELLAPELEDPTVCVYACGPTPMMAAAHTLAAEAGRDCWVSLENPMACGFGVCLGCAAPLREGGFALVCRDGPVFRGADVAWAGLP
ncbi:MAG: dihydroorotate dehydrogenase electron transfer subunit [Myxococcota bacterium]